MNRGRQMALIASLLGWDLHRNQSLIDLDAIGRFMAARYHYWDDDAEHDDPLVPRDRAGGG